MRLGQDAANIKLNIQMENWHGVTLTHPVFASLDHPLFASEKRV
jgi:hypothetical protein